MPVGASDYAAGDGREGLRKEVCLQCLEDCWSFDLPAPSAAPCGGPRMHVFVSLALIVERVSSFCVCVCVGR